MISSQILGRQHSLTSVQQLEIRRCTVPREPTNQNLLELVERRRLGDERRAKVKTDWTQAPFAASYRKLQGQRLRLVSIYFVTQRLQD